MRSFHSARIAQKLGDLQKCSRCTLTACANSRQRPITTGNSNGSLFTPGQLATSSPLAVASDIGARYALAVLNQLNDTHHRSAANCPSRRDACMFQNGVPYAHQLPSTGLRTTRSSFSASACGEKRHDRGLSAATLTGEEIHPSVDKQPGAMKDQATVANCQISPQDLQELLKANVKLLTRESQRSFPSIESNPTISSEHVKFAYLPVPYHRRRWLPAVRDGGIQGHRHPGITFVILGYDKRSVVIRYSLINNRGTTFHPNAPTGDGQCRQDYSPLRCCTDMIMDNTKFSTDIHGVQFPFGNIIT